MDLNSTNTTNFGKFYRTNKITGRVLPIRINGTASFRKLGDAKKNTPSEKQNSSRKAEGRALVFKESLIIYSLII